MNYTLLLMSHGNLAKEMVQSAEMIVGKIDNIEAVSLLPGMPLDEFMGEAEEVIKKSGEKVIILVDLFGGTPGNVATILKNKYDVACICGLNLAILLEAVLKREFNTDSDINSIVEELIDIGKEACRQITISEM